MKLGKRVYRNKLNGEFYRELIASDMPCGITLNEENIKKLNEGVRFFKNIENPRDMRMCSHSEATTHLEEVEYSSMGA